MRKMMLTAVRSEEMRERERERDTQTLSDFLLMEESIKSSEQRWTVNLPEQCSGFTENPTISIERKIFAERWKR